MQPYGRDMVREYVEIAAKGVAAAARSAPHTTGTLDLIINILTPEEIEAVQRAIALPGAAVEDVLVYDGMLTIGARTTRSDTNWDCGACGFNTCSEMNAAARPKDDSSPRPPGPSCNWKVIDWNISVDYAAAMATQLGLQSRVQDIQGSVALRLGYAGDVDVCTTVPLMAEKRNPFFGGRYDRVKKEMLKARRAMTETAIRRIFPTMMDLDMMDVMMSGYGMRLSTNLSSLIEPDPQIQESSGEEEE
ncbi:MAG: DUF2148 domain-containing protein [Candidatus Adiutricales bacterium]